MGVSIVELDRVRNVSRAGLLLNKAEDPLRPKVLPRKFLSALTEDASHGFSLLGRVPHNVLAS